MRKAIPYAIRPTRSYSSPSAVSSPRATSATRASSDRCARSSSSTEQAPEPARLNVARVLIASSLFAGRSQPVRPTPAMNRPAGRREQGASESTPIEGARRCERASRSRRSPPRSRTAAIGAAVTLGPGDGTASSHREAPLIADDPAADITDVYAFRSPDKPGTVDHPGERDPGRGSGRGAELVHVLAQRPLQPEDRHDRRRPAGRHLPLPVPAEDRAVLPRRHRPAVHGDADRQGEDDRRRPRDDAAEQHRQALDARTTASLATKSIVSFDGGASKAFAGQRDDPFFGDIGAIFDLVAIRKGTGNMGGGKDFFAGYGVHTFAVQVPIAALAAKNGTIGVWASVDRRKVTTRGATTRDSGALGAGQPAREPARQRGDHPDRAQGPLERTAAVERVRSSASTTRSRSSRR